MSYDFELYTSDELPLDAPKTSVGGAVRVDGPDRVEDEDIPANHLPILGRRRVLYRIHLEGDHTASDQEVVEAWLGETVAATRGVLINLQTGQFETRDKSGQLEAQAIQPNDNGWMSFYFEDGEKFYRSGFEEMLREISLEMPEATPTRFGYHEPLQGRVEGGDVSELVSSFKEGTDIFMKSKAPLGHIFLNIPCRKTFELYHPKHFIRRKFLLGSVRFELRPKVFAQPASLDRLRALFEKLCVTLDVVYAEIVQTDDVGGWFWYGLPDHQAHTMCLGPAYQSVWPDALGTGRKIGQHHHLVTTDRLGNRPRRPPKDLIAPDQGLKDPGGKPDYATVFPFDYEFDYDTYIW